MAQELFTCWMAGLKKKVDGPVASISNQLSVLRQLDQTPGTRYQESSVQY